LIYYSFNRRFTGAQKPPETGDKVTD